MPQCQLKFLNWPPKSILVWPHLHLCCFSCAHLTCFPLPNSPWSLGTLLFLLPGMFLIPYLSLWESSSLNRGPPHSGSLLSPIQSLASPVSILTDCLVWCSPPRACGSFSPTVPAQGQHSTPCSFVPGPVLATKDKDTKILVLHQGELVRCERQPPPTRPHIQMPNTRGRLRETGHLLQGPEEGGKAFWRKRDLSRPPSI